MALPASRNNSVQNFIHIFEQKTTENHKSPPAPTSVKPATAPPPLPPPKPKPAPKISKLSANLLVRSPSLSFLRNPQIYKSDQNSDDTPTTSSSSSSAPKPARPMSMIARSISQVTNLARLLPGGRPKSIHASSFYVGDSSQNSDQDRVSTDPHRLSTHSNQSGGTSLSRNPSGSSSSYYSAISELENECRISVDSYDFSPTPASKLFQNSKNNNNQNIEADLYPTYELYDTWSSDEDDLEDIKKDNNPDTKPCGTSLFRQPGDLIEQLVDNFCINLGHLVNFDKDTQRYQSFCSKLNQLIDNELKIVERPKEEKSSANCLKHEKQPDKLTVIDQFLKKIVTIKSSDKDQNLHTHWKTFALQSSEVDRDQCQLIESMPTNEVNLYESIFEIILTERSYMTVLEQLKQFPTRNPVFHGNLSEYEKKLFFRKIKAIYELNQSIYLEFVESLSKSMFMSEVITILSNYMSAGGGGRFRPYINFALDHKEREQLMKEKFPEQKFPNMAQLRALLIAPIQRITRYPLLLQNVHDRLLKLGDNWCGLRFAATNFQTTPKLLVNLVEDCLENARKLSEKCNQEMEQQNNLEKLIQFKTSLEGNINFELVLPNRKILDQILVRCLKKSMAEQQDSVLVLFNDILILVKRKRRDKFKYVDHSSWAELHYRKSLVSRPSSSQSEMQQLEHFAALSGKFQMDVSMAFQLPITQPGTLTFRNNREGAAIYYLEFATGESEKIFCKWIDNLKEHSKCENNLVENGNLLD